MSQHAQDENKVDMMEYCKQLEVWLWKAYCQRAVATSAYFTALNAHYSIGSNFGNNSPATTSSNPNNPNTNGAAGNVPLNNNYLAPQQQEQPQRPVNFNVGQWQRRPLLMFIAAAAGGFGQGAEPGANTTVSAAVVVKIAPIWKRLLAECIDFVFLLLVKLFITFTIIDSFELIDLDNIDLESLRAEAAGDGDAAQLQGLYDIFFSLTSELLLLELTHRIVVCFFEGYCLWKAGGTPGKTLLGLRVVYAEDVLPFTPPRNNNQQEGQLVWDVNGQTAIVRPGCFLTFPRAFLRSALKNFSLAFFFPLCFTLFHFDYSRTLYDLMAHSIVIEVQ